MIFYLLFSTRFLVIKSLRSFLQKSEKIFFCDFVIFLNTFFIQVKNILYVLFFFNLSDYLLKKIVKV